MPTYSDNVEALAAAVGADMGAAQESIADLIAADGDLTTLTTTAKSNLVAALNEVSAGVSSEATARAAAITAEAAARGTAISTEETARIAAIAAEATARTDALIALKDEMLGGAGAAFDTLGELKALIDAGGSDALSALNATAALRVGVDAVQAFTSVQQSTGRANLGAAAAEDLSALSAAVGDTAKNFVTAYNSAKAA